jgi:hypothetical protein
MRGRHFEVICFEGKIGKAMAQVGDVGIDITVFVLLCIAIDIYKDATRDEDRRVR